MYYKHVWLAWVVLALNLIGVGIFFFIDWRLAVGLILINVKISWNK